MTREKRPGPGWNEVGWPGRRPGPDASAWRCGPILVLSTLVTAEYPDGDGEGPQWHISISASGKRPKPKQIRKALRAFDLVGAEEDGHHPGVARHFWRPLDAARRVDCQCKADERTVVEADGYTWTTPVDGPCRGCELEQLIGSACPLHSPGRRGNLTTRARLASSRGR